MKIHTLDTTTPKNDPEKVFADLPDEAAVVLIVDRSVLAKTCGQPFTLEKLNWKRHQRALCIGFTEGADAIALFYVSDRGLYAWIRVDHVYVMDESPCNSLVSLPLKTGMAYWFEPSNRGEGYVIAKEHGTAADIRKRYRELHQPPEPKKNTVSSKKNKSDDDSNGAPPVLHPDDGFTPLTSLDDWGL